MEHPRISVIIPALNEAAEIARTLAAARASRDVELLVVDGVSEDDTLDVARREGAKVLKARRGRAAQMNAGARAASGDVLLFLHADTRLPRDFDRAVRESMRRSDVVAGAFRLTIDAGGSSLRLIEAVANWRARKLQMPYGDQAIFTSASRFRAIGGYPELPFMEDFEMVRKLRRLGRIIVLPDSVLTSARRWRRVGAWRATWINQIAVAAYLAGVSPERLGAWYRRGKLRPW